MAVAYVGTTLGTDSAASTSAAVSLSSYSAGQFAMVIISRNYSDSASSVPSGWSLLDSHIDSGWDGMFLYWKILEAGDIGTVTWSGYASDKTRASAFVYSGVASSTPVYSKGTPAWTLAQTYNLGSLASTTEPWIAVVMSEYMYARTWDISSWTSPSWTERYDSSSSSNSEHGHLLADTNGGWTSGSFAPSTSTNYLSGTAYSRGGFIVELKSSGTPPTLSTTAITSITASTASSGGTITSDGGSTITARGVCWNTTGTPTIADSKTID